MNISMMQEFESYPDTDWENNCQYFKVDGTPFPTCVMINDGDYIMRVTDRKKAAEDEVRTLLYDYPTYEMFYNQFGSTQEEYSTFKQIL